MIFSGEGVSRQGEIIDLGVENDVIAKSGSWYSYDGNRIGQGKENVREFLKNNQSIAYEIEAAKFLAFQTQNKMRQKPY